MEDKIVDMVEDHDRKNLSLIATADEIEEMAEGVWSCFKRRGTTKFDWDSGLFVTGDITESQGKIKLKKDLGYGLHWKKNKIVGVYDDLLEQWTEESMNLETHSKYFMTCN